MQFKEFWMLAAWHRRCGWKVGSRQRETKLKTHDYPGRRISTGIGPRDQCRASLTIAAITVASSQPRRVTSWSRANRCMPRSRLQRMCMRIRGPSIRSMIDTSGPGAIRIAIVNRDDGKDARDYGRLGEDGHRPCSKTDGCRLMKRRGL